MMDNSVFRETVLMIVLQSTTAHPDGKMRGDGQRVCLTPEDLERLQARRAARATGGEENGADITGSI